MASADLPAGLLDALRQAGRVVFLTGAGVSAESGVPTFRDAMTGLWAKFRPEELATPQAFARDPQRVWDWYRERRMRVAAVAPNPGHQAITQLQTRLAGLQLVTQNVDGLHQRAGSTDVIEFHGNLFANRCRGCGHESRHDDPGLPAPPACPGCGGLMGPGVVWFGEAIPATALARASEAAQQAEVFISVGTSGMVYPAAGLASVAREAGAMLVEINLEPTPLSLLVDYHLGGASAVILPRLAFELL